MRRVLEWLRLRWKVHRRSRNPRCLRWFRIIEVKGTFYAWATEVIPPRHADLRWFLTCPGHAWVATGNTAAQAMDALRAELRILVDAEEADRLKAENTAPQVR